MSKIKLLLILLISSITLGCTTVEPITKKEAFPEMYNEKPVSLLVVPVVNNTTAADAPTLYNSTLKKPLSELGYYVLPIEFTQQVLKNQGVINGQLARNVPPSKYKEFFGADAVLFVTVNAWDTNYMVVASNMVVSSEFSLYSTQTSKKLWGYNSSVVHDLTGNTGNPLTDLIATALETAVTDYVPIAEEVNSNILSTMPKGTYNTSHEKDGADKFYGAFIPYESKEESLEAKKFDAPVKGKSNIYIYRKPHAQPIVQGIKRSVWVDEECLGDTATSSFFKVTVDTGKEYTLTSQSEYSNNSTQFDVQEDGNYFFEQEFTMGMSVPASSLKKREDETAKKDIHFLSLAKKATCSGSL
ncbi:GNA1162 family protein [Vibrio breoganii]